MGKLETLKLVEPGSRGEWRAWLQANHAVSDGIWLAIGKKGSEKTSLRYDDAVEDALCFGWIDSTAKRLDEQRYRQLLTPRRRGSNWSAPNKSRVARLDAAGLMTDSGRSVIQRAREDGSWNLLTDAVALVVPADLAEAMALDPAARSGYEAYPDSLKQQVLFWVTSAKRAETRAKRISELVAAAAEGRSPR